VSEKIDYAAAIGARQTAKTSCRNPATSLGPSLVTNSLCPGQAKRTMRETEVQIGNSGLKILLAAADNYTGKQVGWQSSGRIRPGVAEVLLSRHTDGSKRRWPQETPTG
jgi:hypothetical protein